MSQQRIDLKFCKRCGVEYPLTKDFWYMYPGRPSECKGCRRQRYLDNSREIIARNRERYFWNKMAKNPRVPWHFKDILTAEQCSEGRFVMVVRSMAKEYLEALAQGDTAVDKWCDSLIKKDLPVGARLEEY